MSSRVSPVTTEQVTSTLLEICREQTRINEMQSRIQDRLAGLLAGVMAMNSVSPVYTQFRLDEAELKDAILNLWVMENHSEAAIARIVGVDSSYVGSVIASARHQGDPRAIWSPSAVTPASSSVSTSRSHRKDAPDDRLGGGASASMMPQSGEGSAEEPQKEAQVRNEPESAVAAAEPASAGSGGGGFAADTAATAPSPGSRYLPPGIRRSASGRYSAEVYYQGKSVHLGSVDTLEEAIQRRDTGLARKKAGQHPKGPELPAPGEPIGAWKDVEVDAERKVVTATCELTEKGAALLEPEKSQLPVQHFNAFNSGEGLVPIDKPVAVSPVPAWAGLDPATDADVSVGSAVAQEPNISPGKVIFVDRDQHRVEGPKGKAASIDKKLIPALWHMADGGLYSVDDLARDSGLPLADFKMRLSATKAPLQRIGVVLDDSNRTLVRLRQAER